MTTLAGRYRLEDVIGRGGMSTVYRATDRVLQRTVAVKVMSAALAESDPTHIARFEREARAAASLVHPGIVTVYDTGVDGDRRFIAMEFVDGQSLAAVIANQAPLDPDRAAQIAADVADALEAAHHAGLVHRDVKPGNVMITRDGRVKVLDFGIARVADAGSITRTASLLGTAAYMAPEHALGSPVDARSDVYSLGCLLYAMLTAHPPFAGDHAAAVLHQQVNAAPRPPSQANPRVRPALDALVLQMLAKEPADRPQSAAEVGDRLRGDLGPPAAAAMAPTSATERLEATSATHLLAGSDPAPPPIRLAPSGAPGPLWVRFLVGLVAIAAVTLIAVLALATGGSNTSQTTSSRHSGASSATRSAPATTPRSTSTQSTTTPPTTTVTVTTPATATTPPTATTPAAPIPPGHAGKGHGKGDKKHGDGGH
jgi:serine/threonine-protein kinase